MAVVCYFSGSWKLSPVCLANHMGNATPTRSYTLIGNYILVGNRASLDLFMIARDGMMSVFFVLLSGAYAFVSDIPSTLCWVFSFSDYLSFGSHF
jgi:hypothetical protein